MSVVCLVPMVGVSVIYPVSVAWCVCGLSCLCGLVCLWFVLSLWLGVSVQRKQSAKLKMTDLDFYCIYLPDSPKGGSYGEGMGFLCVIHGIYLVSNSEILSVQEVATHFI